MQIESNVKDGLGRVKKRARSGSDEPMIYLQLSSIYPRVIQSIPIKSQISSVDSARNLRG
jgi:hypothetical protein